MTDVEFWDAAANNIGLGDRRRFRGVDGLTTLLVSSNDFTVEELDAENLLVNCKLVSSKADFANKLTSRMGEYGEDVPLLQMFNPERFIGEFADDAVEGLRSATQKFKNVCTAIFSPLSASFEQVPDKRRLFKKIFLNGFSASDPNYHYEGAKTLTEVLQYYAEKSQWNSPGLAEEYMRAAQIVMEIRASIVADDRAKVARRAQGLATPDFDPGALVRAYDGGLARPRWEVFLG